MTYDAVIVGTGPAGLSAALALGRARRTTLLIDGGPGRNAPSDGVHNFLSRDGITPTDLRKIALEQLIEYPAVELRPGLADRVTAVDGEFELVLVGGDTVHTRRLLLATEVLDELPVIPGLAERWESGLCIARIAMAGNAATCRWRSSPSARPACARRSTCAGSAVTSCCASVPTSTWTRTSASCWAPATSPSWIRPGQRGRQRDLAAVARVRRRFAAGPFGAVRPCPVRQRSDLPTQLGCRILDDGAVEINDLGQISVPGVYAAGDMARRRALPLAGAQVILAAAEGTLAPSS